MKWPVGLRNDLEKKIEHHLYPFVSAAIKWTLFHTTVVDSRGTTHLGTKLPHQGDIKTKDTRQNLPDWGCPASVVSSTTLGWTTLRKKKQ